MKIAATVKARIELNWKRTKQIIASTEIEIQNREEEGGGGGCGILRDLGENLRAF